jgi:predicted  nucleic acid-binding Zn-ribbon protein
MVNLVCVDECAASSLNEKLVQALTERDAHKKQIDSLLSELEVTRKEVGIWRTEAKREEANAKRWYSEWSHVLELHKNLTKEVVHNE